MNLVPFSHLGVTILVREGSGTDMGLFLESQENQYYYWDRLPSDIKTIVDAGCHIGTYSVWASQHYPDAKIAAIELDRANAALAKVNLGAYPNVTFFNAWLGYDDEGAMYAHHKDTGSNGIVTVGTVRYGFGDEGDSYVLEPITVPKMTLEDVYDLMGWTQIDLMKLDIEGNEIDVLLNASDDMLRRIRYIVGECHQPISVFREIVGGRLETYFDVDYKEHPRAPHLGFFFAEAKCQ